MFLWKGRLIYLFRVEGYLVQLFAYGGPFKLQMYTQWLIIILFSRIAKYSIA